MSASNYNFVCFTCRTAIRHPKPSDRVPECRVCGQECFCLGYKVEVPTHKDIRGWRDLEAECARRKKVFEAELEVNHVRRIHWTEKEIERLTEMPDNRDRNREIKKLKDDLTRMKSKTEGEPVDAP